MSGALIVSDLEIAIASPSFASLLNSPTPEILFIFFKLSKWVADVGHAHWSDL